MENQQKTICLCAIMRQEEKALPRLIESCAPIIDYWVIIDTGSTDKSMEIVTSMMAEKGIPGELHQAEWVNFKVNRNELLGKAFGKADFLLLMDIDMTVHPTPEFDKTSLNADAYYIHYTGDLDFAQQLLVSGKIKWRYENVTHEYIMADVSYTNGDLRSLPVTHHFDGGMRSDKLERDRKLLEQDIIDNPDNTRNYFYLAQTYNNLKLYDKALTYYRQRISKGVWPEEVYYSMYQVGLMLMHLKKRAETKQAFLDTWEYRPSRFEALYMLGMLSREDKKYYQGAMYLETARNIPYPKADLLFIHKSIYDYLIKFDLAICYFYTGRVQEAKLLNEQVIANPSTPEVIRTQTIENQGHVLKKLGLADGKPNRKDFLLISFFTEDTQYQLEADMLSQTCSEHKVSHEIYQIPGFGSWEKNTQHKAVIIRDALLKHKKPLVWVDADARVKKFPELFLSANVDIMYHYIEPWNEMLVGTIYFDYNDRTIAFCNRWIELNLTNDNPDGKNFQQLMTQDTTLSKEILPKEYCSIFDNEHTVCSDPVILHTQASRRHRNVKPASETSKYLSVIDELDNAARRRFDDVYSVVGNGPFISHLTIEINDSFVMRCNDFKIGIGIGIETDLNISSLYHEIVPTEKVDYPILGILPITNTGYQKFTTAKQMHIHWENNAKKCKELGNTVITYTDQDRFFHEVFLPIAESINAIPTVGILAIALARWWKAKKIIITGFTFFESEKSHYNKEENVAPSMHHNVQAEKLLLRSWMQVDDIHYVLDGLTREVLYDYKKKKWAEVSQPFEINWHKTQPDWRSDEKAWAGCKENILAETKLSEEYFNGKEVLDVGCGPRSMLEFFPKSRKTYIEPLGEEYKKMYEFLNGDPMFAVPAEQFVPELENKFDFVWCHNVLDHCYDWRMVLENIFRYIKPGGYFYIATDAGFPPNDGHPGIETTETFMNEMDRYDISEYHLKDVREPKDEVARRSIEGANHQIRSINLIGTYNATNTSST